MHPVRFTHCVSASTACDGIKPWMVQDIQLVNGTDYVTLKASDPDFCRFIVNKGRSNGGASSLLHKWQAARTTATLGWCVTLGSHCTSLFDDVLPTAQSRKRAKATAQTQELPPYVPVVIPGGSKMNQGTRCPTQASTCCRRLMRVPLCL